MIEIEYRGEDLYYRYRNPLYTTCIKDYPGECPWSEWKIVKRTPDNDVIGNFKDHLPKTSAKVNDMGSVDIFVSEFEKPPKPAMKLCKTCKHFTKSKSSHINDIGDCDAVVQYADCTTWENGGVKLVLKPEFRDKLAFVRDTSDYYACLMPRENFGCVQHEELP